MWKEFWYYSREEKKGIIVLVVLIVVAVSSTCILSVYKGKATITDVQKFEEEYSTFVASLKERKQSVYQKYASNSSANYDSGFDKKKQEPVLAPFDPNTTDSLTFLQLGLPAWMAKNILRYRAKGGKFRTPEDFRKIYNLTEEQFTTLLPYIYIGKEFQKESLVTLPAKEEIADTVIHFKYSELTIINLNAADTTELKKIPGIGSGIAHRIVNYRKQLGGFYRVEQLQEIPHVTEEMNKWFRIEANANTLIPVNKASIERLRAHPYINFYQAKVIVEHRKKKGNLKSLSQLQLYDEFTQEDMERIGRYVSFD